jgi:selenocysteine-specific elongation factor
VAEARLATALASTLAATLASTWPGPLSRPLLRAIAGDLARAGHLNMAGGALRLAGHTPRASAADEALWRRAAPHFTASQPRPPVMGELAAALETTVPDLTPGLQRLARLGWLVELGGNRFVLPEALRSLATLTENLAREAGDDTVDIALFRDRSGIGRNHAVRVLEHFDSLGLTRRTRDGRKLLRPTETVFGPPPPSPDPQPC